MDRRPVSAALGLGATVAAFAFLVMAVFAPFKSAGLTSAARFEDHTENEAMTSNHYLGLWVTGDGHIRHELLPNGRYVEARGNKERAYQGRYAVKGDHIDYVDDTGFTADGDFRGGILYHAGMVLYRD